MHETGYGKGFQKGMNVLTRYLVKEFFKLLFVCQTLFVSIYVMVHFFGRIDNFLEAQVAMGRMLSYFVYQIPFIFVQMLAPATLIAVIIQFSIMKKNNEIIALKACGLNVVRLVQPVILTACLLAVFSFVLSEVVVPYTSSMSNHIYRVDVKKMDPGRFLGRDHIWYRAAQGIYWIRQYDGRKEVMQDLTFYFFDDAFRIKRRIDARTARWEGDRWEMLDGAIFDLDPTGTYSVQRFDRMDLQIPERPENFAREERKPEEMGYWQLKRFAEQINAEGYDAGKYMVDLNVKLAFPVILLVMVILGAPIALKERKWGTPLAVSIGMVYCFAYLLVLGLSRSLGFAGVLPPVIAAWLANAVFLLIGLYMIMDLER